MVPQGSPHPGKGVACVSQSLRGVCAPAHVGHCLSGVPAPAWATYRPQTLRHVPALPWVTHSCSPSRVSLLWCGSSTGCRFSRLSLCRHSSSRGGNPYGVLPRMWSSALQECISSYISNNVPCCLPPLFHFSFLLTCVGGGHTSSPLQLRRCLLHPIQLVRRNRKL